MKFGPHGDRDVKLAQRNPTGKKAGLRTRIYEAHPIAGPRMGSAFSSIQAGMESSRNCVAQSERSRECMNVGD